MKILSLHYRSLVASFIKIVSYPFEHLLNILTIAVIITALCITLIIGKSVETWQQNTITYPQIVVYLKTNANQSDVSSLEKALNTFNHKDVKSYQFISKAEGLKELQQDSTLKQIASDTFTDNNNPLPDVLVINTNTTNVTLLQTLSNRISNMSFVDNVQMDSNYANKISELVTFINDITHLLQIAFATIMAMVIYNMIRLQMSLRQDEIIVSRLIGASNSFIMRPLIYYATIQILLGAAVAFALGNLFTRFVNNLFANLGILFGQNIVLSGLSHLQMLQVSLFLVVFGIFAVFLAVRWVFRNSYVQ